MKFHQLLGFFILILFIAGAAYWTFAGGPERLARNPSFKNFLSLGFAPSTKSTATSTGSVISAPKTGPSPYAGVVRVELLSFGFQGQSQWLFLKSYAKRETIDLTGWSVTAGSSTELIPKIPAVYLPGGKSEAVTPARLKPGGVFAIFSNTSPVRENLQLNKCMGYLDRKYTFSPSLNVACYQPTPAELSGLSGQCRAYIASVVPCTEIASVPDSIPQDDKSCRAFVENMNYEGCVKTHRNDADFFGGDWGVWVGVRFLPQSPETIVIKDSQGRVVQRYAY